jgi:hypothetical protein
MRKYVFLWLAALFALTAAEIKEKEFTPQQKRWWAFQPVQKAVPPVVKDSAWVKNPIDAFVLAKLEEKGIKPNPHADNLTLLRRASLDIIGLPPTPEEVQAMVSDPSPDAFDKAIDRLLASPRYGERWARHWLDLARYADSEGFKSDETRPNVWRYRDYVIQAFNNDKPYDRFVKEQLAGDELYPGDPEALVATGFNRHFPDESNARNLMQRRQELMFDIVDTVGSTFMGLTYGCAKCHDHKFDPILQKDYYRLQAFFANTRIEDNAVLEMGGKRQEWQEKHDRWDERTKSIRHEMAKLAALQVAKLDKENFDKFPEEIQDAITTAPDKRTPIQWHMYYKAKPQIVHTEEEGSKKLRGDDAKRYAEFKAQLKTYDSIKPYELPVAQAMIDNGRLSPKTHVLSVGVYDAYKQEVEPGALSILDPSDMKIVPPAGVESSGRRAALANWLTDPKNPLTARVMVNRIWHYHFGRGIAATPSDFGVMGEFPSNRPLLDYLAATFVEDGWSMKKLHKLILTSNTWQQSSAYREEAAKLDPQNKYMWRFNRQRMEGEVMRDSMLYTAGRLNTKMGGPGVFPPLPPGVDPRGGWKKNEATSEADRRSVYVFVRRNVRYPMFETFDMPDTHESCARRNTTVSSNQALDLLNSSLVFDWSKSFADRVMNDGGMAPEAQIDRAYKLAYARTPNAVERSAALAFLDKQSQIAGGEKAAFADLCHMLFNSNEFLYVN